MKQNRFYKPKTPGFTFRVGRIEINISFLWFDFWVGLFYDRANRTLYACPLPTLVFRFRKKSNFKITLNCDISKATEQLDKARTTIGAAIESAQDSIAENIKKELKKL
jgi:hypothetical protein